ncbi:MAG TPA: glycosyl hydrolase, partial [Edaphobacter sp.]|nr:glycosyl hydrolase [Edaphobacter sp.]
QLIHNFQNPPAAAKPMMRWWWFGPAVVKPELEKELHTMQKAGIGGVEIQPVYPLMLDDESKGIKNLPYLSPGFLSAVTFANDTARSLGMRVDITLGSGWPYGGPKTTLDLSAGKLRTIVIPLQPNSLELPKVKLADGDTILATFIAEGTPAHYDPATAVQSPAKPSSVTGDHVALIFVASHTKQTVKRPSAGAEGLVLDHLSRPAIDEHLTDVATPLLQAFGAHPPYAVFSDSLEVYGSDWTTNLPEEFKKRRHYDLLPHLPELAAGGTPQAEAVRHDWGQTISELVAENYLTPINAWAANHHTKFRSQTYGLPAVTLVNESIPTLPEGEGPQWRAFSFTRWASSASHLYNRNITSAETFTWLHSPVFRATPLDMKAEADRMFLLGVNQIIGHGWPYSPPAAGEPGWSLYAAAVFNDHNPWFPVMPDVTKYLQRTSWLLRQGKPSNDIAILLPEDDAQAAFSPGHASVTDEMKRYITPELMAAILDAGYNIDYIDAATIDKLGTIPYPILILPPTDRIPLVTYRKIKSYASSSGKVISLIKSPSLAPGLLDQASSPEIAALSSQLFHSDNHKGILVSSLADLPEALHKALPPDLAATGQTTGLGFIHRKLPGTDIYFIANTGNQPIDATIRLRSTHPVAESWNLDTAATTTIATTANTPLPLTLAPYESRVFVLKQRSASPTAKPRTDKPAADLTTSWQLQFANSAPQLLTNLPSWTDLPDRKFYSGEATYTHAFTLPANPGHTLIDFGEGTPTIDTRRPNANGVHALLDPPIREAAIVYVNGKRAGSLWHPPYRLDITALTRPGKNTIEVHVYNTALNAWAALPPHDYKPLIAKYGDRFQMQDLDQVHPLPSGLLGPIHLVTQENK